jgi:DNA-directed RNA polymerase specialized sigma24 family protein
MAGSETTMFWWDREADSAGRPIRADVRSAAHEIWEEARRRTQALLADQALAADVMEGCVAQVSRYLNSQAAPLCSRRMNGLLMLAFSRTLRRRAAKLNRLESVGGTSDLSNHAIDQGWSRQVEARLDLDNIVRQLSERGSTVLALRWAGYDWKEIAQLLGASVAKVRSGFWREIKQAKQRLHTEGPDTKGTLKSR